MRLQPLTFLLPLLPTVTLADNPQYQGLFDRVKGYAEGIKDFIPSNIPDPIDAGASKVAGQIVERINIRNFQRKLSPKLDGEEEWMVYFTGGNKSCFGRCGPVDLVWNESVPLLAALPSSPSAPTLHLGKVDCEKDHVLCTALSTGLPGVWHFMVPQKPASGTAPKTPLHIVPLNVSTTNVGHITSIPSASKSRYLDFPEYTGSSHPIDGWLAQTGLLVPLGYVLWGLGSMPSWVMMIVVGFVSRQIMSRRMSNTGGAGQWSAQQPPAADRPRAPSGAMPPPAARGGSSQGKMVGGGKKKK